VPKHKIVRAQPERLTVETTRKLMAYLEEHHADWCLFFTLTLFLGIRPDMIRGKRRAGDTALASQLLRPTCACWRGTDV
jgi:hypothetical protein